jgi:hypothetical protein
VTTTRTPLPRNSIKVLIDNGYDVLAMQYIWSTFRSQLLRYRIARHKRMVDRREKQLGDFNDRVQVVLMEIWLEDI